MTALGSHDEVVAWAEAMVPTLAARAPDAETARRLPEATIADCDAIDLWSLVVPPQMGGAGLGLSTLCEMSRTLARGCASTAWTVSFLVLHNAFVLRARPEVVDAVFAGGSSIRMASPLALGGRAEPCDGGHLVSGRWSWATGVLHADWVSVMAPAPKVPRVFLLPVSDVDVLDVWHTSGMRATGSQDVAVEQVFVPDANTMTTDELRGEDPPGAAHHPEQPLLRYPLSSVLCLYAAATAVGAAEAAVDHFRDVVGRKVMAFTPGTRQVEQATTHARLAEARAAVRASRLVWRDGIDELCGVYDAGGAIPRVERARFRLAAAHAVRLAREAVETASAGIGAGAYVGDNPFPRIERDLAVLKGHVVYDWDRVTELAGRLELGFDPAPTDML